MPVFGKLAGPQLMCRLELLSLSALTYVTGPGVGEEDRRREYTLLYTYKVLESEKKFPLCF